MSINALIPARGGSKGIPNKNILNILGYPLIDYTIFACKMCDEIGKIYVSTDCEEIANVVKKHKDVIIIDRPKELASDTSTDFDVLKHFFELYLENEDVAYMRPTTPNRQVHVLKHGIIDFEILKKMKNCTGMRSVHVLSESPYKLFKENEEGFCEGFFPDFNGIKNYTNLPRQIFPEALQPNGYIDIVRKSTIESGSDFGDKIVPFIVNHLVYELDKENDIDCVERDMLINDELYNMMKNYNGSW